MHLRYSKASFQIQARGRQNNIMVTPDIEMEE